MRSGVVARDGRAEAAAFDRHVSALRRLAAAGGVGIEHEAAAGLELVDRLEHVMGG